LPVPRQNTALQEATAANGEFDWSTPGNWIGGVPADGAIVTVNISSATNPGGYDNIANLELYQLNLTQGAIAVAGTLQASDRRHRRLKGRPPDTITRRLRQAGGGVRRAWRRFRLGDPILQRHNQRGPAVLTIFGESSGTPGKKTSIDNISD
jgi:hypothetical protein